MKVVAEMNALDGAVCGEAFDLFGIDLLCGNCTDHALPIDVIKLYPGADKRRVDFDRLGPSETEGAFASDGCIAVSGAGAWTKSLDWIGQLDDELAVCKHAHYVQIQPDILHSFPALSQAKGGT